MNRVVTVNLNGNAYQLEEPAYDALRAYLDTAAQRLAADPDKAEIISDLEQAIAEKCRRYLGPHKDVVTAPEIATILEEMGPVSAGDEGAQPGDAAAAAPAPRPRAPRRLYRIREGAMISGVCTGLAAYFNVDVSLVRIAFVVLTLLTSGGWLLAYLIMMFVVPSAETSEERAAAHGLPFNAQELVDRAKRQYAEFREQSSRWHERWRRKQELRRERRERRAAAAASAASAAPPPRAWSAPAAPEAGYATRVIAGFMVPVFTLLSAALFVVFVLTILSLLFTGGFFYWRLPHDVPVWVIIIVVAILFQALHTPLRAASRASYETSGGSRHGWLATADTLLWVAFAALLFWIAYEFIPEVEWLFESMPHSLIHVASTWNAW